MEFTESFKFGNSTFMNIESQVKRAIICNENSDKENELTAKTADVISESPTKSRHLTIRDRSRRNSILSTRNKSNFTVKENAQITKTHFSSADFTSISHIEIALANTSLHCEEPPTKEDELDMNKPIFSEDIMEMLNTSDLKSFKEFHDKELETLDASAFIEPMTDNAFKAHIASEIAASFKEVSISEAFKSEVFSISERKNITLSDKIKSNTEVIKENLNLSRKDLKYINNWNLPISVLDEYKVKGVTKMFDWQVECLSNPKVLFEHCNLVYSAPTSAGKTLVSEILLLKTVLERKKKVLFILPFISVVREKMNYLQDLLSSADRRVEGFYGGYTPPGGFENIHVAICTIEKANSIVNKLLEQGKLELIGTVVVDEVHLISDPNRGYILELLLAKLLYMSNKFQLNIQIITMSATLSNLELLQKWLKSELYTTDFRPVALQEMIKIDHKIYDNSMKLLRDIRLPLKFENNTLPDITNDNDHLAQLCIETLLQGCGIIVFCPSKDWCENLALQLAGAIHNLCKTSIWAEFLCKIIKREAIDEIKAQLRDIPTGLERLLEKTITYGCAYHHAGLTTEEREIIEDSFKKGALKIIVATSTLSSGVNLPARRVLIRTPLFGGKTMSSLTYKQMIGRAGRTGKDTLGESILICTENNARKGRELISAELKPISSCLDLDNSTHLKRAILEVISAGVANTQQEIDNFFTCTLLHAQHNFEINSQQKLDFLQEALDFLLEYEFIRLQKSDETSEENYVATRLGNACLASSMPPADGLILFAELQKARRCFVLESDLHALYLVTPYSVCYQLQDLDWLLFLELWEKLTPAMRKVGELVGVKESFVVRAMRGQTKLDYKLLQIHKRFYTALALQELVNEMPINEVGKKFKCTRGMLQGLQQIASTFAGIVTAFCNSLQWYTLGMIVSQFKERLFFGIHHDLIDLMRLPDMSQKRARALYNGGITSLVQLAQTDVMVVEKILYNALSFDLVRQQDNENIKEAEKRNSERIFFITGKSGLTIAEGASLLIQESRQFVQHELGVEIVNWSEVQKTENEKSPKIAIDDSHNKEFLNKKDKNSTKFINSKEKMCTIDLTKNNINIHDIKRENNKLIPEKINNELKENFAKLKIKSEKKSLMDDINAKKEFVESEKEKLELKKNKQTSFNQFSIEKSKVVKGNNVETTISIEKPYMKKKSLNELPIENPKCLKTKNETTSDSEKLNNKKKSPNENSKFFQNNNVETTNKSIEMPSTSREALKFLRLKKVAELKRQAELKRTRSPSTNEKKSIDEEENENKVSDKKYLNSNEDLKSNIISSTRIETKKVYLIKSNSIEQTEDLFAGEPSLEIDSCIEKALVNNQDDEIPNSQNDVICTSETPTNSKSMRNLRQTQRTVSTSKSNSGIFTRSKRLQRQTRVQNSSNAVTLSASSSLELSDFSIENSLLKQPLQLNASNMLYRTKSKPSLKIEIVDICSNINTFQDSFNIMLVQKRLGFSLGMQKYDAREQPVIGAKLLKQEKDTVSKEVEDFLFKYDNSIFIACLAFVISDNTVYYMNMQNSGNCRKLTFELKCKYLRQLFHSKELTLLIYDAKEHLKILFKIMPDLKNITLNIEDPRVANWLIQPDIHFNIQQMVQEYTPEHVDLLQHCENISDYESIGLQSDTTVTPKIRSSIEAYITMHVLKSQIENLKSIGNGELYKFFKEIEMPIQLSLCHMEIYGFGANETVFHKLCKQMQDVLKQLETKVFEMHGARFNFSSTTAVAKVLGLHRKSNGKVSTSRQILEKIDSPIAQLIILHRKVSTTLAKNIKPLLKCIKNDRIYGNSFTLTSTGRISMNEPNLQNVAKDFEINLGKEPILISCRNAFLPKNKQFCLISADFCQLEMRILAHLSQDSNLLEVMNSPIDLFTAIAARWNHINETDVTPLLRENTKRICYGIVYGMGLRSLSEALKCTEDEARQLMEQFHATYTGIQIYTDKVIKFAHKHGYIETITGRRRYLEHIKSADLKIKKQAERQSINSSIQGSAADIAKSAILRMEKNIVKYREKLAIDINSINLVLHMHDELIFEVPSEKAHKIAKVLSLTMEKCVKLSVPLHVKVKIGPTWGQLKEYKV